MLEAPDLPDGKILACLQDEYGLLAVEVAFLHLGADQNTAVYRAVADDGKSYFVKLRRGIFDESSVALPKFLGDLGIAEIIAPLATKTGRLWASLDVFRLILYPFVEGSNGYEVVLSDRQWREFGVALKRIHTADLPAALGSGIQRETYSPQARAIVKEMYVDRVEDDSYVGPVAANVAAFLRTKRAQILDLVGRAERLAEALQAQSPQFILCHSDIHAGNILVDTNENFYIVDWDDPILAPKERDLMFIGGAQGFAGHTAEQEEALFYRGYGQTEIDPAALAYYRYERIVQDIAVYCEQLLMTNDGGDDREQSFRYLKSNFLPNGTIKTAYRSDRTSGAT